jgi:hypothetical protein
VCETIEAARRRVFLGGKHGEHGVPVAIGGIAPSLTEDALAVLPQHLETTIRISAERRR